MIKKETNAIFEDGDFKGEYDWKGGIPLSEGEEMKVHLKDKIITYILKEKKVDCLSEGENQLVKVVYRFKEKQ